MGCETLVAPAPDVPGALLEAAWVGALDPTAARWVAPLRGWVGLRGSGVGWATSLWWICVRVGGRILGVQGCRGLGGPSSTEVPH